LDGGAVGGLVETDPATDSARDLTDGFFP